MATRSGLNLSSCTSGGLEGRSKGCLARLLDHLHHVEELNPIDDTVSVFIHALEHFLDLCIVDLGVSHTVEGIFEFCTVDRAIRVCVIALEGIDHLCDLFCAKVLAICEGHIVSLGCWVCFDHSVDDVIKNYKYAAY